MALTLNTTQRLVGLRLSDAAGGLSPAPIADSLRVHIEHLFLDRKAIVLHLGEVDFVDSSGLGTMVRMLTKSRQLRGDVKACNDAGADPQCFEDDASG